MRSDRIIFVMALMVCAACRSAIELCGGSWECVKDHSAQILRQYPRSPYARHDYAYAELMLASRDTTSPLNVVGRRLEDAARILHQASVEVAGGSKAVQYRSDAEFAEKTANQFASDLLSLSWQRIEDGSDPDTRILAVMDHDRFYGRRCPHDLKLEYQRYVDELKTRDIADLRGVLLQYEGTTLAPEILDLYIKKRCAVSPADDLPQTIYAIRLDLDGRYGELLRQRFGVALDRMISSEKDPDRLAKHCAHADDENAKQRCLAQVARLWQGRSEDEIDLRKRRQICLDKLEGDKNCLDRVGELAVDEYVSSKGANEEFANEICILRPNAGCRQTLLLAAYSRQAEVVFGQLEGRILENAPPTESVQQWQDYIRSLDVLAVQTFGQRASLQTVAGDWYRLATARISRISGDVDRQFVELRPRCDDPRTLDLIRVDECLEEVKSLLDRDQNSEAKNLMRGLLRRRADLNAATKSNWERVTISIGVGIILRTVVPDATIRIAILQLVFHRR